MSAYASNHSQPGAFASENRIQTLFAVADKHGLRRIPEIKGLMEMVQNDPKDEIVIELLK